MATAQRKEEKQEEEQDRDGEVLSRWAMHSLGQHSDQGSTMHYTSALGQLQLTLN